MAVPVGRPDRRQTIWRCHCGRHYLDRSFANAIWLRLGVAIFVRASSLAACLLARRTKKAGAPIWQEVLAALLAGAYLGSLAFAGHGEEGLGLERNFHLAADFFHLIAAGLWLGGLIPLALLLVYLRRFREETWISVACDAASRFSNLGIVAVGILLVSGTINAWFLIGRMQGLIGTSYGRLLLLKITLFAAMVCLAGINRQYLLPRLFGDVGMDQGSGTVRWLVRSALVEIALGLGVIIIVGSAGHHGAGQQHAGASSLISPTLSATSGTTGPPFWLFHALLLYPMADRGAKCSRQLAKFHSFQKLLEI